MKKHKRNRKSDQFDYGKLENRNLLATAFIGDVAGRQTLIIDGCNRDDIAEVADLNASQVRLTLNGQNQDFDKADFDRIRFLGRLGDDEFTNNTDIDSAVFGHSGNDILRGGNGHNWIQGGSGNDQLTGGDRNDLLRGRAGDDVINGGRRHDRLFGNEGNDSIVGGAGNDLIGGDQGADQIFGLNGNDRIMGADGNDHIETGAGNDFVQYSRVRSAYTIFGDTTLTVTANVGGEGIDSVTGAEFFEFTDQTVAAEFVATAQFEVIVRPIIVSNSNGSNTAESFGTSAQEDAIKRRIDELYAQADIDIVWQAERMFDDTFTNIGNTNGVRPQSDLNTIVNDGDDEGIGSPSPTVIDIYFVEKVPGFGDVGENTGNGLAFIDSSGIAVHVGDNLVNSGAGRDIVARVIAHEIGHNLGLPHIDDDTNLLNEDGAGELLTQSQIIAMQNSDFARPI